MKHSFLVILFLCLARFAAASNPLNSNPLNLEDIILDIYNATSELGETDYEQLQTDLYALHDAPIDLNHTSDEELSLLHFLSPQQIDEILAYADKHPFGSLYELRMIQSLADYEIRDLLPFVTLTSNPLNSNPLISNPQHELIARVDARNIESNEAKDPIYFQTRYRFDMQRRITAGVQLRRPVGGEAKDLQYGAYIQLRDIAPHLHTVVAGNFQASFGQGLVFAPVFRTGKSSYVTSVGQQSNGLRYYSSVDGEGLHGAGATLRWEWNKITRLDVSALYSMKRYNDSVWHHLVGANITFRHKQLELQLTAAENIWSDSIHPYRNAKYNRHYFRGRNQAVLGASFRYHHAWFDAFAEFATTENYQRFRETSPSNPLISNPLISNPLNSPHWGFGTIAGSRFYPTSGVSLIALYRYYSPYFDNPLGYAFSETSRLNDENGGYLGFEITRWRNWRLFGYGDVFYFSGYKYGLGDSTHTLGYDALAEVQYHSPISNDHGFADRQKSPMANGKSPMANPQWWLSWRIRVRQKGTPTTYSTRFTFDWQSGAWSLRTTADANLVSKPLNSNPLISNPSITYGVSISQDLALDLTHYTLHHTPLSIRLRVQAFDSREWDNRIYCYEHDVLYAFSIPATYGIGCRAYLCLKWQIIPQLALYFKASETIYDKSWAADHDRPQTRTDLHLLLRARF